MNGRWCRIAASKRKSTVIIRHKRTSWRWLVCSCVALLLLATSAQAAHLCGLLIHGTHPAAQSVSGASGAVCITCLMAQSSAEAEIVLVFSSNLRCSARVLPPQMQARSFLESFQLYVRPPPAAY